jgi:hypothetical protein
MELLASYPVSGLVPETEKEFLASVKPGISKEEKKILVREVILRENDSLTLTVDTLTQGGVADEELLLYSLVLSLPNISRVIIGKLEAPFISPENLPGALVEVFAKGDLETLKFVKEYFTVIPPGVCVTGDVEMQTHWSEWKKFFFSISQLDSTDNIEEVLPKVLPTADLVVAIVTLENQYIANPARVDESLGDDILSALEEGADFYVGIEGGCSAFQRLSRLSFPTLLGKEGKDPQAVTSLSGRSFDVVPILKEFIKRDPDLVNSIEPGYPPEVLELFLKNDLSRDRINQYLADEVQEFNDLFENDNIIERLTDDEFLKGQKEKLKNIETLVKAGGNKELLTDLILRLSPSLV